MVRYRRIGYALLALGVVLSLHPFVFAGGTERACPGIESIAYDTIGIHPAGFAVTEIELMSLEVRWYDGCNWRTGSLVPMLLGIGSFIVGITAVGRSTKISA